MTAKSAAEQVPKTARKALILINLGTPQAPTAQGVRRFLRPFLSDRRVVDLPRLLWLPILYLFILSMRPRRVARAYQRVWEAEGSPLAVISKRQIDLLGERLPDTHVRLAVTYGRPGLAEAIEACRAVGSERIVVLPLYPQYSATTSGAVYDCWARYLLATRNIPDVHLVRDYHRHPAYIAALADSVRASWRARARGRKLLMSFHGIPQAAADAGDPYPEQCRGTAEALAAELELGEDQWELCFQSRFGPSAWLQPYADQRLRALGAEGLESLDVICPGFAVDCLETLEEIAIEGRETFIESGGGEFHYIPCLNDRAAHIALFEQLAAPLLA